MVRYTVNEIQIRSENTAKPTCQKSSAVDDYLKSLEGHPSIMDFGCGKLRYSDTLVSVASSVTFIDSCIQLDREQVVRGVKTSVRSYIRDNYPGCYSICYEEIANHKRTYDIVTCINVLSAIPCKVTLLNVICEIHRLLIKKGVAVFVNQYKSTYFKRYESGVKHLYGYIYEGNRGYSYYGIMGKSVVEKLLEENGFIILRSWRIGEATFTEATPC